MSKKNISFEDAMKELEEIVTRLEDPKNTMAESMELFQRGVELTKLCESSLKDYEGKITMLIEISDGEATEEVFEAE